jgi:hypothetical protein
MSSLLLGSALEGVVAIPTSAAAAAAADKICRRDGGPFMERASE